MLVRSLFERKTQINTDNVFIAERKLENFQLKILT